MLIGKEQVWKMYDWEVDAGEDVFLVEAESYDEAMEIAYEIVLDAGGYPEDILGIERL